MLFGGLYEEYGSPFTGRKLEKLKDFLLGEGLSYDSSVEHTVELVNDEGEIAASGSIAGNVLKCIAVSDAYQGEGLSASVVTSLCRYAFEHGRNHLFLFTKPKNEQMFSDLGFSRILKTGDILFMENRKNGIRDFASVLLSESSAFISSFQEQTGREPVAGAIVANCNPFTLGHRYLIETALSRCDLLHLFILSEDRSEFSGKERYEMVKAGTADLSRVILHHTSDYIISQATFPTYFMKDQVQAGKANCELDVRIFGEYFAETLSIRKRFAGTEPTDAVTAGYNEAMRRILPEYGVEFVEIERKKNDSGAVISAKEVRRLLQEGKTGELAGYLPATTIEYLAANR